MALLSRATRQYPSAVSAKRSVRAALAWRMTNAPELRKGAAGDLPLLEPLWVAVHHRHAQTMPRLAPYVSDEDTWAIRSTL